MSSQELEGSINCATPMETLREKESNKSLGDPISCDIEASAETKTTVSSVIHEERNIDLSIEIDEARDERLNVSNASDYAIDSTSNGCHIATDTNSQPVISEQQSQPVIKEPQNPSVHIQIHETDHQDIYITSNGTQDSLRSAPCATSTEPPSSNELIRSVTDFDSCDMQASADTMATSSSANQEERDEDMGFEIDITKEEELDMADTIELIAQAAREMFEFKQKNDYTKLREKLSQIAPHLIHMKQLNRMDKISRHELRQKVKEVQSRLIQLTILREDHLYDLACLEDEIRQLNERLDKKDIIKITPMGDDGTMDAINIDTAHRIRMADLDVEANKRKLLSEQLSQMEKDIDSLESKFHIFDENFITMKPVVKKFVDTYNKIQL